MKRPSFVILLGICFTTILVLTACSGTGTPGFTQALAPQEEQVAEITPPTQVPTETSQDNLPVTEEIYPGPPSEEMEIVSVEDGSYPPPGDQAPGSDYPPPEELPGGYPAPDAGDPTPSPAYPAPESEPGGYPSPDLDSPPPVKVSLEATDPSTVNLASGELQFVEFFAFW
jgi:hypothetical protein